MTDVRSVCIQLLNDKYLSLENHDEYNFQAKEEELSNLAAKQFDPEFWYLRKMLFWIDKKGPQIPSNFLLSLLESERWDQQLCHIPYQKKFIINCVKARLDKKLLHNKYTEHMFKRYKNIFNNDIICHQIIEAIICYAYIVAVEANILADFDNIEFRKIVRTKHIIVFSSLLNKEQKDNLKERVECNDGNDDASHVNNKNADIHPYELIFMSRKQMLPNFYENKVRLQLKRAEMEDAEIVDPEKMEDGFYECKKCHKKKTRHFSVQMRSADEPATNFVRCYICHFTDKFQ